MEEEKSKRKTLAPLSASTQTSPQMGKHNLGGEKVVVYFTSESWKGVKTVFKCAACGAFRDTRDTMIEHVLIHFPKGEQEAIFNQLVKE